MPPILKQLRFSAIRRGGILLIVNCQINTHISYNYFVRVVFYIIGPRTPYPTKQARMFKSRTKGLGKTTGLHFLRKPFGIRLPKVISYNIHMTPLTTPCKSEAPELTINNAPCTAVTSERNPTALKSRAAPAEGRDQCRFNRRML